MRRKTEARTGKGTDGEVGDQQETVWNGGSARTRGWHAQAKHEPRKERFGTQGATWDGTRRARRVTRAAEGPGHARCHDAENPHQQSEKYLFAFATWHQAGLRGCSIMCGNPWVLPQSLRWQVVPEELGCVGGSDQPTSVEPRSSPSILATVTVFDYPLLVFRALLLAFQTFRF